MIVQLSPQIPVITPKGNAKAILLIDYSEDHNLMWVCIQDDSGEIWTWPNYKIRGIKNVSMDRNNITPINNE